MISKPLADYDPGALQESSGKGIPKNRKNCNFHQRYFSMKKCGDWSESRFEPIGNVLLENGPPRRQDDENENSLKKQVNGERESGQLNDEKKISWLEGHGWISRRACLHSYSVLGPNPLLPTSSGDAVGTATNMAKNWEEITLSKLHAWLRWRMTYAVK